MIDKEEREWLEEAISTIVRATEKKVWLLLTRRSDEHDAAVTNVEDAAMVAAMAAAVKEPE